MLFPNDFYSKLLSLISGMKEEYIFITLDLVMFIDDILGSNKDLIYKFKEYYTETPPDYRREDAEVFEKIKEKTEYINNRIMSRRQVNYSIDDLGKLFYSINI